MQNQNEIILHTQFKDIQVYTIGKPDYDGMSQAQKRAMLLPLVETIREFYKDPENLRKFELWKAEREKQNSTA